VRNAKTADDNVEAVRVERKIARITLLEGDTGVSASSYLQWLS
jgi:hypothetical protein